MAWRAASKRLEARGMIAQKLPGWKRRLHGSQDGCPYRMDSGRLIRNAARASLDYAASLGLAVPK